MQGVKNKYDHICRQQQINQSCCHVITTFIFADIYVYLIIYILSYAVNALLLLLFIWLNHWTACFTVCFFFHLYWEILSLHCWNWWEDNGFQIPAGVSFSGLPLKNVICWHTQCWGREAKQFVTELDHFLHRWDIFVHMLYSISAGMVNPLGRLSEEENKGSRTHCVVCFYFYFLNVCVSTGAFAFACQSLTMGVVLLFSQVDSVCRIW